MEFNVCLDQFEGPLDLMLHLVRTSKLDLFELNLDLLAGQYVAYIRQALNQALDVSSEYLVEFTALMEYKSRRLLPKPVADPEDTYLEDPAAALARRLLEYERCQRQAALLSQCQKERSLHLERPAASLIESWQKQGSDQLPEGLCAAELSRAMSRILRRLQVLQPYQTSVEIVELSVEERMEQILAMPLCTLDEPFLFERLLDDTSTLRDAVVTFLALLELVHNARLAVRMDPDRGEIWICRVKTDS